MALAVWADAIEQTRSIKFLAEIIKQAPCKTPYISLATAVCLILFPNRLRQHDRFTVCAIAYRDVVLITIAVIGGRLR